MTLQPVVPPTSSCVALAAKILSAYVSRNTVPASALPDLLTDVHGLLTALDQRQDRSVQRPTEAQIQASIRPDAIVSFEDGKPYKALRRHLTVRGLTPEAYRAKWGLPVDYPLVSAVYSARRSKISQAIGLSQRVRMQQAAE
jgi:predicted transcriptional regulator